MSDVPKVRRADRLMSEERTREMMAQAYAGRLATVGADGWPYIVPLLFVWLNDEVWVHNTRVRGHLRANVDKGAKVCFEADDPGEVFPYGRFECDTSVAYRSVVVFGEIRIVEDREEKKTFFDTFMKKCGDPNWDRPKGFFPRLDQVTVYAIAVKRMTGKETPLPANKERWPAVDNSASPDAVAP